MLAIPKKLHERASALGFICSSEQQEHTIRPQGIAGNWHLTYRKGYWVLIVNNIPQMNLCYEETLRFLDRFPTASADFPGVGNLSSLVAK